MRVAVLQQQEIAPRSDAAHPDHASGDVGDAVLLEGETHVDVRRGPVRAVDGEDAGGEFRVDGGHQRGVRGERETTRTDVGGEPSDGAGAGATFGVRHGAAEYRP